MAIYGGPIFSDLCIQMQPGGPLNWLYNLLDPILQATIDALAGDPSNASGVLAMILPGVMTDIIGNFLSSLHLT